MIDLNNLEEIKKLDPKNVYGATEMFISQCEQIWEDAKKIVFPEEYKNVKNIILCGMGGSAYSGYVIQSLFKNSLKIPVISNNDYQLPACADENSLILLSSYSGSTEEVLLCGEEAYKKNIKVTGITIGGKLGELLAKHNAPHLLFDPKYNPSGQPRLGTGYMILGTISLLCRTGFLEISDTDIAKTIAELKEFQDATKKSAKDIAKKLQGYIPVIFSAEFLNGNAHILRNQFNETSKSFSAFEDLPELNHHLLEGLKNPHDKKLMVLFLASTLYSAKLHKRTTLTQDVVEKNHIPFASYNAHGSTEISQMLNTLSFGGYVSLYLAFLYGLDPSLIPWVDYFKEQLAK